MGSRNARWFGIAVLGIAILGATAFLMVYRSAEGKPQVWRMSARLPLLPMTEMVSMSDVVVIGRVKEFLPSRWNTDDGKSPPPGFIWQPGLGREPIIYTDIIFEVGQVLVGDTSLVGKEVRVRIKGGTVGQDTFVFEEAEKFEPGERALVFLFFDDFPNGMTYGEPAHYGVVNAMLGKWQILDDESVVSEAQSEPKYYPYRTLSELLAAIDAALTPTAGVPPATATPLSPQPTPAAPAPTAESTPTAGS